MRQLMYSKLNIPRLGIKTNSTQNLQITNDQFSSSEKNFINIQNLTVNQFPGDGEAIRIQ
jgi:hypothetical protein